MASSRRRSPTASKRSPTWRTAGRVLAGVAAAGVLWLGYLAVTVPDVRPLIDQPPADTAFMRLRARQAHAEGRPAVQDYRFVPYPRIAQTLKRAVLVAEDSGFWEHEGIEFEAIKESFEAGLAKGAIVRGGSTITQQLAKNLYLSPSQNPLRKLRELMIAYRLERLLSKRRIFELYLNVAEWGNGTWGAEAASRRYFRKPASSLGASEAALLAGSLINPIRYSPADPPVRLRRRQQLILRRMGMRDAPVPPAEREPAAAVRVASPADATVETPVPVSSSDEQHGDSPQAPTPPSNPPAPQPSSEEVPARPSPPPVPDA
jgi:monofunctional biosynthetic peptidoglycan transglycosylase